MAPPLHNYVTGQVVSANSHAVAYGEIAYRMAFLKAHYPAQFWAAALSHEDDLTTQLGPALASARRQGVVVLPPDIHHSTMDFLSAPGTIRCSLRIVRGIGEQLGQEILAARAIRPFDSLEDLLRRVPGVGRRIPLRNLVLCGALDVFPGSRAAKLARIRRMGQRGTIPPALFADWDGQGPEDLPEERLQGEWESTGSYLTGHPAALYRPLLAAAQVLPLAELENCPVDQDVLVGGVVMEAAVRKSRQSSYFLLTLSDETAIRQVHLPAAVLGAVSPAQIKGQIWVVEGKRLVRPGSTASIRLQGQRLVSLDDVVSRLPAVTLVLPAVPSDEQLARLENLQRSYAGYTHWQVHHPAGVWIPSGGLRLSCTTLRALWREFPESHWSDQPPPFFHNHAEPPSVLPWGKSPVVPLMPGR
jgi:DNA polymerase III alpha subunit